MSTPQPPRPAPVLPQPIRGIAKYPIEARARQVLASSRAPAQMSLFLRPCANDPK